MVFTRSGRNSAPRLRNHVNAEDVFFYSYVASVEQGAATIDGRETEGIMANVFRRLMRKRHQIATRGDGSDADASSSSSESGELTEDGKHDFRIKRNRREAVEAESLSDLSQTQTQSDRVISAASTQSFLAEEEAAFTFRSDNQKENNTFEPRKDAGIFARATSRVFETVKNLVCGVSKACQTVDSCTSTTNTSQSLLEERMNSPDSSYSFLCDSAIARVESLKETTYRKHWQELLSQLHDFRESRPSATTKELSTHVKGAFKEVARFCLSNGRPQQFVLCVRAYLMLNIRIYEDIVEREIKHIDALRQLLTKNVYAKKDADEVAIAKEAIRLLPTLLVKLLQPYVSNPIRVANFSRGWLQTKLLLKVVARTPRRRDVLGLLLARVKMESSSLLTNHCLTFETARSEQNTLCVQKLLDELQNLEATIVERLISLDDYEADFI